MILVGTAGHVDHGKSTLVRALTGIDPVHLPEERERGMTIELGFAHIQHPDGYTLGIVDVPGHEKLVRTMISGATGFQLALWVVDAREGPMPQSLEHLEVLDLLGAAHVLPVITKADLASETEIGQTRGAVDEALARTRLGRSPTAVVDSVSGRGIDQLESDLFGICRTLATRKAATDGPCFMPIDRSFVLRGVGTVVTGTLVRGRLRAGESVQISSSPEPWRIRSLHNHSQQVEAIEAGHRVGVHLHGVRTDNIARGDVLVAPGYPFRSKRFNAELHLIEGRSFRLKQGIRALFLAAASEVECRLWGFERAGSRVWAQVELPAECCFYPDQRFILRSTNPLETAGAGTAVDLVPDRRRRITPAELRYYEGRNLADYVRDSPGGIAEAGPLALRWLRDPREVLDEAAQEPHLAIVPARLGKRDSTLLWHDTLPERTLGTLAEKVAASGSVAAEWPLAELAGELGVPRPLSHALLREVLGSEAAGRFRETLRLGPNTLRYDPEKGGMSETERKIADRLLESLRADALKPDRLAEYARASGADRRLFDKVAGVLIRQGRLVRIDNEFALGAGQWEALLRGLGELPASGVTPAEFGRHFGITRKHTMPYLEGLNRMGMMRREGGRHRVVGEKVARGLTHGHGSGESPRSNS